MESFDDFLLIDCRLPYAIFLCSLSVRRFWTIFFIMAMLGDAACFPYLALNLGRTLGMMEPSHALDFLFVGERHFVSRISLRSSETGVIIWYKNVSSIHKLITKKKSQSFRNISRPRLTNSVHSRKSYLTLTRSSRIKDASFVILLDSPKPSLRG